MVGSSWWKRASSFVTALGAVGAIYLMRAALDWLAKDDAEQEEDGLGGKRQMSAGRQAARLKDRRDTRTVQPLA